MIGTLKRIIGRDLAAAVAADAEANGLRGEIPDSPPVTEAELAGLPEPVRRYMQFMGVVGRPRDRVVPARADGALPHAPSAAFMPFEAWQHNTRVPVARLFHMRIDFAGFVPMIGRDAYVDGRGSMRGKLLGVVPVADGRGDEFDLGELVTWLNDAIMLLPVDAARPRQRRGRRSTTNCFDVSFTDCGNHREGSRARRRTGRAPRLLHDRSLRRPPRRPRARRMDDADRTMGRSTHAPGTRSGAERPGISPTVRSPTSRRGPFPGRSPTTPKSRDPPTSATSTLRPARAATPAPWRTGPRGRARRSRRWSTSPLLPPQPSPLGRDRRRSRRVMPGDELVPVSHFTATRAVTIGAPPDACGRG